MSKLMNSIFQSQGLALESEDATVPANVDEVGEEVVAELDEVKVDGADEEDKADTEEAVATLESLVMVLESALPAGGITKREALLVNMAAAGAARKLRMKPKGQLSLESFGGTTSRHQATKLALEGVGTMLSNAYATVIKWLKAAIAKLKDLWIKVKQFCRGLFDRIDATQKKVKELKTDSSANETFDAGNAAKGFATELLKKGDKDFKNLANTSDSLKIVTSEVFEKYMPAAAAALADMSAMPAIAAELKEIAHVGNLPGHVKFEYANTTDDDIASAFKFTVTKDNTGEGVKCNMLNKEELTKILENCKSVTEMINGHQRNWALLDEAIKKFEAGIKKESEGETEVDAEKQRRLRAVGQDTVVLGRDYTSYAVGVSGQMVKYAAMVVANWEAKTV